MALWRNWKHAIDLKSIGFISVSVRTRLGLPARTNDALSNVWLADLSAII